MALIEWNFSLKATIDISYQLAIIKYFERCLTLNLHILVVVSAYIILNDIVKETFIGFYKLIHLTLSLIWINILRCF